MLVIKCYVIILNKKNIIIMVVELLDDGIVKDIELGVVRIWDLF